MGQYMVLPIASTGRSFVKERSFFVSQGGDREAWGKNWRLVEAGSIEEARAMGEEMSRGSLASSQKSEEKR